MEEKQYVYAKNHWAVLNQSFIHEIWFLIGGSANEAMPHVVIVISSRKSSTGFLGLEDDAAPLQLTPNMVWP